MVEATSVIEESTDHPLLQSEVPLLLEPVESSRAEQASSPGSLDWRQSAGIGLLAVGAIILVLGWYGVSGTTSTAQQLSYFISGGLGGAALVAVGVGLLISFEHVSDRRALARLEARIDRLEGGIAAEFDAVLAEIRRPRARASAGARRIS